MDVLEIDGASNRGIEEIRSLRETVKFKPASSAFKIYIIDEVHTADVDSSGHVARRELAAFDGAWDWVDALADPLVIDGHSLYEVVSEIARRAGLTIRFLDPASETAGRQLLLRGRALNLPPRSALGAVLATTSLDGTVEGRQIVIAPGLTQ